MWLVGRETRVREWNEYKMFNKEYAFQGDEIAMRPMCHTSTHGLSGANKTHQRPRVQTEGTLMRRTRTNFAFHVGWNSLLHTSVADFFRSASVAVPSVAEP